MYKSEPLALAWKDAKDAALFFDKVLPADLKELNPLNNNDLDYDDILDDILPNEYLRPRSKDNLSGLNDCFLEYLGLYFACNPEVVGFEFPDSESYQAHKKAKKEAEPILLEAFETCISHSKVKNFDIVGTQLHKSDDPILVEPSLILSSLDLIDSSKITWEKLIEFRKDKDSKEKLRQLRRFVYDSLSSKSSDYIREDIERRMAEYKEVTRFWDFPTRKSVYKIGLTSSAATVVADTLGVALFGAPLATIVAGASTTIGGAAIALESRRREIEIVKSHNPISYLIEAERLNT